MGVKVGEFEREGTVGLLSAGAAESGNVTACVGVCVGVKLFGEFVSCEPHKPSMTCVS